MNKRNNWTSSWKWHALYRIIAISSWQTFINRENLCKFCLNEVNLLLSTNWWRRRWLLASHETQFILFYFLLVTHLHCDYCCCSLWKKTTRKTNWKKRKKNTFKLIFVHFSSFAWRIRFVQSIVVIRNSQKKCTALLKQSK